MAGHVNPPSEKTSAPEKVAATHRRTHTGLYLIAWFAFLAAAVGLTARYLPVTNHTVLILAAASPYLMTGAAVSALILLLTRKWWAAGAAVALTAAAVVVELPLFIGSAGVQANTIPVRVLAANVHEGTANPKALAAAARDRADLLVLVELTPELAERLTQEGLDADFPYRVVDAEPYAAGVAIWSRFPISRSARIPGYQLGVVSATVRVPHAGADTTVLAAHLTGPWPQPIDDWRHDIAAFADTMNDVTAGTGAVVVAGDFNAAMDMRPFRRLLGNHFRDAAEQSGAGLAPTYPAGRAVPPLIGIDHILTANSVASNAHTVRIPGSDHLGIWAVVHVPR